MIAIFAGLVLGGRPTVVMNVVSREDARIAAKHRGNTAARPKGKKPTVTVKIVAGMVGVKKIKKTWMIKVPQSSPHGV